MSIASETLKQDIDKLDRDRLQQVADFIAFVKFRDKRHRLTLDPTKMASLFAEFADEDRSIAESGIGDYRILA
jgi:hypothetical protein